MHGVFRFCKNWTKFTVAIFNQKIRRTKCDLIIKLITQMDGNPRDESIKPIIRHQRLFTVAQYCLIIV